METSIASVQSILDEALHLEEKSETFYRRAASNYEGTGLQMLFLQLAEEEVAHQKHVEQLHKAGAENFRVQMIEKEVEPSTLVMEKMDFKKDDRMEKVVETAIEMEKTAAMYYSELGKISVGPLASVLKTLENMERSHVQRLEKLKHELTSIDPGDETEFHAH